MLMVGCASRWGGDGAGVSAEGEQVSVVVAGPDQGGYLKDAAKEAERLGRWEFMFTLHVYQISGGTASPFNGVAMF